MHFLFFLFLLFNLTQGTVAQEFLCFHGCILWVLITRRYLVILGFPSGSVAKNLSSNIGDPGSIPGLERAPGEGNGNPL